jgi:hypothetical protein
VGPEHVLAKGQSPEGAWTYPSRFYDMTRSRIVRTLIEGPKVIGQNLRL